MRGVKTLRLHFPVLDVADVDDMLEMVTEIDGVVAAMVDEDLAYLDVAVESEACGLLVQEQVMQALRLTVATLRI